MLCPPHRMTGVLTTGRQTPTLWYGPSLAPLGGGVLTLRWAPGEHLHPSSLAFQNDVSEKEQRWGAKTVQGSGHQEHIE